MPSPLALGSSHRLFTGQFKFYVFLLPQGMSKKREVRRRRHFISAWITVEGSFVNRECQLIDVSETGAKIILDWGTNLPTRFLLKRIPNSARNTVCNVMWRRGRMLGIKFVR